MESRPALDPKLHPCYRTRICRHYVAGRCNRGDACNFAHGESQLRTIAPSPSICVVKRGSPTSPKRASETVERYEALSQEYVLVEEEDWDTDLP